MTTQEQDDGRRGVGLERTGEGRYLVTNARGGSLALGRGADPDFTPVELLLAALAGCSAVDVELVTGKRVAPDRLAVDAEGRKVRDHHGHHLEALELTFDVTFPDGTDGDRARARLPRALEQTRDRLCTVARTIQVATPVVYRSGRARLSRR